MWIESIYFISVFLRSSSKMEDLEIEYTPSLSSKRFSTRDELLQHFLKFSQDGELK